jgi:hypothetical protein
VFSRRFVCILIVRHFVSRRFPCSMDPDKWLLGSHQNVVFLLAIFGSYSALFWGPEMIFQVWWILIKRLLWCRVSAVFMAFVGYSKPFDKYLPWFRKNSSLWLFWQL